MKFIAVIFTAILATFGATAAHAATPDDCAESDDVPDGVECPVDGDNYPIVLPEEEVIPDPTTTTVIIDEAPDPTVPPTGLPATGSDGTSMMLQVAGLLLVGGLVVLVGARRRSPASPA